MHGIAAGAGLLAIWVYARLGERRPRSVRAIGLHLAAALLLLGLTPAAISALGGTVFSNAEIVGGLFGVLLPALTYLFLSALWLFTLLQRALSLR